MIFLQLTTFLIVVITRITLRVKRVIDWAHICIIWFMNQICSVLETMIIMTKSPWSKFSSLLTQTNIKKGWHWAVTSPAYPALVAWCTKRHFVSKSEASTTTKHVVDEIIMIPKVVTTRSHYYEHLNCDGVRCASAFRSSEHTNKSRKYIIQTGYIPFMSFYVCKKKAVNDVFYPNIHKNKALVHVIFLKGHITFREQWSLTVMFIRRQWFSSRGPCLESGRTLWHMLSAGLDQAKDMIILRESSSHVVSLF